MVFRNFTIEELNLFKSLKDSEKIVFLYENMINIEEYKFWDDVEEDEELPGFVDLDKHPELEEASNFFTSPHIEEGFILTRKDDYLLINYKSAKILKSVLAMFFMNGSYLLSSHEKPNEILPSYKKVYPKVAVYEKIFHGPYMTVN